MLEGERNAYRDIAVLNAAAALVVAEAAADLREGAALAARALDSGAAKEKLEALVRVSNRAKPRRRIETPAARAALRSGRGRASCPIVSSSRKRGSTARFRSR